MRKTTLIIAALLAITIGQPVHAEGNSEIRTKGITWSIPSYVSLPASGCIDFPVTYTWGSTLAASGYALARLSIRDNNDGFLAYHYQFRDQTAKSGTVQMKLCRQGRLEAGYDEAFVGAEAGTVYVTAFFYDMGNINRQNQLDEQQATMKLTSSSGGADSAGISVKMTSPGKNKWSATITNAEGKDVTVMIVGQRVTYFRSVAKTSKHVITKVHSGSSGKTLKISVKVGSEWILNAEPLKIK